MKLMSGFVVREVGGKTLAVAVGATAKKFRGMISLNGTGKVIWECLQKETNIDQIVDAILNEYETDRATAEKDVIGFVGKLREAGLIID